MKSSRRKFLKLTGLVGTSVLTGGVAAASSEPSVREQQQPRGQKFNMCGYAAPKLDTVRAGFIGLGNRGPAHVDQLNKLEGVEIRALCDLEPERVEKAKRLLKASSHNPTLYSGDAEAWKKLCERDDIDLVFVCTPWNLHAQMAIYAMSHGKHVCVEVPVATTLEECWQLVETSERTRRHCMMMENVCYGFFELMVLNMVRQGVFGELIHGEGAYIHHLLYGNFSKDKYSDMWRLKANIGRNGSLYPTHGIGPVCQAMDINRGDKMDFIVSVSSNDFMMGDMAKKLAAQDEYYRQYVDKPYRGNMNTSLIRTTRGRTIMLQHDVTSPRPKSEGFVLSGTKATAIGFPTPKISIAREATPETWRGSDRQEWISDQEFQELEKKYTPNIVKKLGEVARQVGYHGGGDFLMDWRTIDCLRNGLPLDQDVYDAALWSSLAPLSESSVKNESTSVKVPDFTGGAWKSNQPLDIRLEKGGNTQVKI